MKKRPTIRSLFLSALSVAAGALVIVLAVWNIGASINLVQAADGEKKTKTGKMTYYHYTVELGNKIQPTTLFVGTYLISLKALNDMNYGEALQSRKDYNQNNIYYKTELDDNSWHDILNAQDINKISPGTKRIDEGSMRDLIITVIIGEDGVPRDPNSMTDKNPFEDPDPYGLRDLPELEPLVTQYDTGTYRTNQELYIKNRLQYFFEHCKVDANPIQAMDGATAAPLYDWERKRSDEAAIRRLETAYDSVEKNMKEAGVDASIPFSGNEVSAAERVMMHWSDTRDEYTAEMDAHVKNLWDIYLDYKDKNKTPEADAVYAVTGNVDSERRARVFYNLTANEEHHGGVGSILSTLFGNMTKAGQSRIGRYYPYMEGNDNNYSAMDAMIAALNASIRNCEASYRSYSEKGLVRGNTAMSQYSYDAKQDLLLLKKGDSGVDTLVASLVDVTNIKGDKIENRERELALMRQCIMPMQNQILSDYLTQGVPADYDPAALSEKQKEEVLQPLQDEAMASVEEIEQYVTWTVQRLEEDADRKSYYSSQIDWVEKQKQQIPNDDFLGYAEIARQSYEDWLKNQRDGTNTDVKIDDGDVITGPGKSEDPVERAKFYDKEAKEAEERDEIGEAKRYRAIADRYWDESGKKRPGTNTPGGINPNSRITTNNTGTGSNTGSTDNNKKKKNKKKNRVYRPTSWRNGLPNTGVGKNKNKNKNNKDNKNGDGSGGTGGSGNTGDKNTNGKNTNGKNTNGTNTSGTNPNTGGNNGNNGSGDGSSGSNNSRDGTDKNGSDNDGRNNNNNNNNNNSNNNNNNNNGDNSNGDGKDSDSSGTDGNDKDGSGDSRAKPATGAEAQAAADALRRANGDTGNPTGGRTLSDADMLSALEDVLGMPFDSLGPDMKGAAVVAFNEFGVRHSDEPALVLARRLLVQIMEEKNPLVYLKLVSDSVHEYVSFGAVDRARSYTGFRLVEHPEDDTAVLSAINTDKSFHFRNSQLAGPQVDYYIRGSQVDQYAYLHENESKKKIDCRAEYINNVNYAVLVTGKMEPAVAKIVARLEELAGYSSGN